MSQEPEIEKFKELRTRLKEKHKLKLSRCTNVLGEMWLLKTDVLKLMAHRVEQSDKYEYTLFYGDKKRYTYNADIVYKIMKHSDTVNKFFDKLKGGRND